MQRKALAPIVSQQHPTTAEPFIAEVVFAARMAGIVKCIKLAPDARNEAVAVGNASSRGPLMNPRELLSIYIGWTFDPRVCAIPWPVADRGGIP